MHMIHIYHSSLLCSHSQRMQRYYNMSSKPKAWLAYKRERGGRKGERKEVHYHCSMLVSMRSIFCCTQKKKKKKKERRKGKVEDDNMKTLNISKSKRNRKKKKKKGNPEHYQEPAWIYFKKGWNFKFYANTLSQYSITSAQIPS